MEKEKIDEVKEELENGGTRTPSDEVKTDDEKIEKIETTPEPTKDGEEVEGAESEVEAESENSKKEESEKEDPEESKDEVEEKKFTQAQLNELIGIARQEGRKSALKDMLTRYGVSDENELNDVFGRGQQYDVLSDDYENQSGAYKNVLAENALLKTKVPENRWEDVKLILGGKGLEVTEDNIVSMLPTHPEWQEIVKTQETENSEGETENGTGKLESGKHTIESISPTDKPEDDDESEKNRLLRIAGLIK